MTGTLAFSVLGSAAQGGISLVVVTVDAGSVTEVSVSTAIGSGYTSASGRRGTVGQRQSAVLRGTFTARGR